MTSYSEALAIVLAQATREMPVETVPLVLAAGRVLAGPVVAEEDIPASANSAMDGYAIRAADVAGASIELPARLRVVGEASAGNVFTGAVGHHEAVRIMTGGIVPEGADAVIEVEATHEADAVLDARRAVRSGESIRAAGEDVRRGAEVLSQGRRLSASDVGVLASLGIVNVPVRVKPKVGILSTGSEVVEPSRRPAPGQIRNSTGPALYAMCSEAGTEPIDLGIAADHEDEIEERLEEGLRYDILLTTGGVSAGAYDLVQRIIPALGVEVKFHKVAIRPGRPLLFGVHGGSEHRTLVFGLPGNPVSTLVTFRQFVAPAIAQLMRQTSRPLRLQARLATAINKQDGKRHFVRGILGVDDAGRMTVATTGTQSSGVLTSLSRANCLIILGEDVQQPAEGTIVDVEMI